MIYYFASINDDSFVDAVHMISSEFCTDENNEFNESMAIDYLNNFHGNSTWIQTWFEQEDNKRYNFAGIGYYYYEEYDAFIPPKPGDDFILSENFSWVPIDVTEFMESLDI
jgi:hypothetical protein